MWQWDKIWDQFGKQPCFRWSHHETPRKPPHLLQGLWKTIAAAQDDIVGIGAAVSLLDRQRIQRVFMEFQEVDCAPKPDV